MTSRKSFDLDGLPVAGRVVLGILALAVVVLAVIQVVSGHFVGAAVLVVFGSFLVAVGGLIWSRPTRSVEPVRSAVDRVEHRGFDIRRDYSGTGG